MFNLDLGVELLDPTTCGNPDGGARCVGPRGALSFDLPLFNFNGGPIARGRAGTLSAMILVRLHHPTSLAHIDRIRVDPGPFLTADSQPAFDPVHAGRHNLVVQAVARTEYLDLLEQLVGLIYDKVQPDYDRP